MSQLIDAVMGVPMLFWTDSGEDASVNQLDDTVRAVVTAETLPKNTGVYYRGDFITALPVTTAGLDDMIRSARMVC